MRVAELDERLTTVPVEAIRDALGAATDVAVLPVRELERGTACLLIATTARLWVVSRVHGRGPGASPSAVSSSLDWHEVGVGPFGAIGRVPGGLLGGGEATDHCVTIIAGDHLYEARLHGERGIEAIHAFVTAALRAGAAEPEL